MGDIVQLQTEINLFGQEITDKTWTKAEREPLAVALHSQLKDFTLSEFAACFTNRFNAVLDYIDLCEGKETGQRISLLFNPHRLDTGTKRFPLSLYQALKKESFCRGLMRVIDLNKRKGTNDILYASVGMGIEGTSYIQEFPPHVARNLALDYKLTKTSRVLDPCAGWGGRMLGFSAVVDSYTCCEPSTRTAAGLRQLYQFIRNFRSEFNATIHEAPFEDVQLQNGAYDFAMTSPPYYDTEWYAPGESANSFNRYPTFQAWCDGFYAPLIHRTMAALKPDACFVINIGSRLYPLNEQLFKICENNYAVEKQKGRLSASNGLGKSGEGETFYEVRRPSDAVIVLLDESALTLEAQPQAQPEAQPQPQPESVNILTPTVEPLRVAETHERATTDKLSALDFALAVREPDTSADVSSADVNVETSSTETSAEALPQKSETEAKVEVASAMSFIQARIDAPATDNSIEIQQLADALRSRGHRLLTKDGKFFISNADKLTTDERALVKKHKAAFIAMAEPWTEAPAPLQVSQSPAIVHVEQTAQESGPSYEVQPAQSLAQFLGGEPPREVPNWRPDEPPDLTGIDEIILNFATSGFDWLKGDRPVGVTVSTLDGKLSRFLPFGFQYGGNLDEEVVKRWMREQVRGKKITNSKTKFDIHHSREWGVDLEAQGCTFSDIQHTAALLDDHRKRFGLDFLAADYLPDQQMIGRVDESQHQQHHASEVAAREHFTVQLVRQLRDVMYPQIDAQELRAVHDLEDEIIPCVVEMEKNGSPIDLELLEQYGRECNTKHDALIKEVSDECGFAFDHTASGWKRLIESLRLSVPDSFAETALNEIDHPLIRKGQRAAQYASLNSKIFKAYPEHIVDGILRYSINQLASDEGGTVSGRFSIGLVQQVPNADNHTAAFGDELFPRRLFIAGSGDYFEGDAAQIEFRLLVHYSGNARLLQAYRDDPKMSFHKKMQEMLKAYKPDMLYSHTKSYNFAAQYGARSIKLAVMMGFITAAEGEEIRDKKAWNDPRLKLIHEIEAAYKSAHPEAGQLLDYASHLAKPKCDKYCKTNDLLHRKYKHRGFVKTLLGRRSRFPDGYKTYIGLNRVLQGTGADIMKKKLVELHALRKETDFVMRITNHDAVLGDARAPHTAARVAEILNRQSFDLKVQILWECGTGKTWADCK